MNHHASPKKHVMAIWNWSSGELCGPWSSCLELPDLEISKLLIFQSQNHPKLLISKSKLSGPRKNYFEISVI